MKRKYQILSLIPALAAAGSCTTGYQKYGNHIDTEVEKKPNVLLIVADDHGYGDFSFKNLDPEVKTPNLDKFVSESVNFTNGYATSSISSPSRCGILTGSYQQRWGNKWYGGPGIADNSPSIAEHFKQLDYTTAYFGKNHFGNVTGLEDRSYPHNHGFDESLCASHGGRTHYLYHSEAAVERYGIAASEGRMNVRPMLRNGQNEDYEGFTTEKFGEETRNFIKNNKRKPFFCQLSFNAVHNFTWQLPKEYLDKLGLDHFPDWNPSKQSYTAWYDTVIRPNLKNGRAYYLAQLLYLDLEIGKIMNFLEENNLREDTIIIYTSDNGGSMCNWGMNTPLRGSKYTMYEGGIRVPYFISWKGKIKPGTNDTIVSAMDIMPTTLAAAGRTNVQCDGVNLLPMLLNNEQITRDTLVWDVGWQYAVRKGDWKLKVTTDALTSKAMEYEHTDPGFGVQLYNLKEDISETRNLAKENPSKVMELKSLYRKWKSNLRKAPGTESSFKN